MEGKAKKQKIIAARHTKVLCRVYLKTIHVKNGPILDPVPFLLHYLKKTISNLKIT